MPRWSFAQEKINRLPIVFCRPGFILDKSILEGQHADSNEGNSQSLWNQLGTAKM